MALPDAVRAWFTELMNDTPADPTETPEPVGQGENPTTEPDAVEIDATSDEVESAAAESVEDGTAAGESNTLPEPESGVTDAERDDMTKLAAVNEALRQENADLRARIAELGGDTALGITEEVVEDLSIDDTDTDDYDPEADIAEQEAEVARLRGDNTEQKD